jgi:hypothetical protein
MERITEFVKIRTERSSEAYDALINLGMKKLSYCDKNDYMMASGFFTIVGGILYTTNDRALAPIYLHSDGFFYDVKEPDTVKIDTIFRT